MTAPASLSAPPDGFAPALALLRRRTGRKWSDHAAGVLPAWIADMDFPPAPAILETLAEAMALGDFGYGPGAGRSGVPESFAAWADRRWAWAINPATVMLMPDMMSGIANCIDALTKPGDAVLVQAPCYPPLLSSVRLAGRELVEHPLATDAGFDLEGSDFERLEATVRTRRVKLLILCHPHNPTGRSFSEAALRRLAALIVDHDLLAVSDEIHADLTLDGRRHVPLASLGRDIAARTVTLNGPGKAFNVAGLRLAVCVAPAPLRGPLTALPPTRWDAFSTLGVRAALAAWSGAGEAWLIACTAHLERMRALLASRLPKDCPGVVWRPPQAGYLAWLDCRALAQSSDPASFFLDEARVALSPGSDFGASGRGHARLNFATSEVILTEILDRMGAAWRRADSPAADRSRKGSGA